MVRIWELFFSGNNTGKSHAGLEGLFVVVLNQVAFKIHNKFKSMSTSSYQLLHSNIQIVYQYDNIISYTPCATDGAGI